MNLNKILDLLNQDLANEYTHMMFYMVNGSTLTGLQRQSFSESFQNHAKSEMSHATAFQDLIVGLGGVPSVSVNPVPVYNNVQSAIEHAINMETEVVNNYFERIRQAEELGGIPGLRIKLFMEKQFEDSLTDLEELKNLIC